MKLTDYAERGDLQLEIPLLTRQLDAVGSVEQAALAWADGLVHRYLVACDLALFDFRLSLDEGTPSASFELHTQVIPWRGLEIDLAAEEKGPLESSASEPAWTLSLPDANAELTFAGQPASALLEFWRAAATEAVG